MGRAWCQYHLCQRRGSGLALGPSKTPLSTGRSKLSLRNAKISFSALTFAQMVVERRTWCQSTRLDEIYRSISIDQHFDDETSTKTMKNRFLEIDSRRRFGSWPLTHCRLPQTLFGFGISTKFWSGLATSESPLSVGVERESSIFVLVSCRREIDLASVLI